MCFLSPQWRGGSDDAWPQLSLITSIDGLLRIPNLTNTTRVLKKNEHFCQIREVFVPDIVANNLNSHVISQAVHTHSPAKYTPDTLLPFKSIQSQNYLPKNEHHSVPSLMNTTRCLTLTMRAIMVMLDHLRPL